MKPHFFRSAFLWLFSLGVFPLAVAHASSPPADSVHFCAIFDYEQWRRDHPRPAAKRLTDLNVGEPRTVRMIYFLPNDRPYRQEVVDSMQAAIGRIQVFYGEQMQAHGHGEKTFRFETDAQGEPLVHRVDGQHPESEYFSQNVFDEIEEAFDIEANIYLIVLDSEPPLRQQGGGGVAGVGGRTGKGAGFALVPDLLDGGITWDVVAHELGHAFGLYHDFRDPAYIMSFSPGKDQLSACNAEFLAVHPYFNPDVPIEEAQAPAIELLSPRAYPAGSESISIQLEVGDAQGVHQAILFAITRDPGARGDLEVKACHGLAGEKDVVVDFEFDGVIPSDPGRNLSNTVAQDIVVSTVDSDGNVREERYRLAEISPYRIAALEGHTDQVQSVAFSPEGTILASGSDDGNVKLWDVETRTHITTLQGHGGGVYSVAFTPDGTALASGSADRTIILWDVETKGQTRITTLRGLTNPVRPLAFSPDGTTLASGLGDGTIVFWDVEAGEQAATVRGHAGPVRSLVFTLDGSTLASVGSDRIIKLWDVETRVTEATLDDVFCTSSLAFSPDGTSFAFGSGDGTVWLWNWKTRERFGRLLGHVGSVSALIYSPDGTTLASMSDLGEILLWDVLTEDKIEAFGDLSAANSVAFSSDGATLASGSQDGTVVLWDIPEWAGPRPYELVVVSGEHQQGTPGAALVRPLVVEVRDQYGKPLPDATVIFKVTAGDGKVSGKYTTERVTTDAEGRVAVTLTLGLEPGTNTVGVSLGGPELVTFHAEGLKTVVTGSEGDLRTWHLPEGAMARLGTGWFTLSDRIVAFSPDSRHLAVASKIGVWLYEAATARPLALLPTEGSAHSVAFAPGGTLVLGLWEGSVQLWEVGTGTLIATMPSVFRIDSMALSADGTTLAVGSRDGEIKLRDLTTQTEIGTLEGHTDNVRSLSFSPDGTTLASGSFDLTVKLWDVPTHTEVATLKGHEDYVTSVVFSPDGSTLASGSSFHGEVHLWDVGRRTIIATFGGIGHVHGPYGLSFSPDGTILAAGMSEYVWLWDLESHERIEALGGEHLGQIQSVAFSPDGTGLAAASITYDGGVSLWDVKTKSAATLGGHSSSLSSVALSPDGALVASGSFWESHIKLWDLATQRIISTLQDYHVNSVAFSPDGALLASGAGDLDWFGRVRLWDVATRENIATLEGHTGGVNSVAFSPDGALLASGSDDRTIKLWDVVEGALLATLEGHTGWVTSVSFSPDGGLLAAAEGSWETGEIRLWDVATRDNIATLEGHTGEVSSVSFSPDGGLLAAAGGSWGAGEIGLWDVATRDNIATLKGHTRWVKSVSFSPDGALLASGGRDGIVKLWDVTTRENIATLKGHTDEVRSVVFSPDGSILTTGSEDGTMLLWDMELLQPRPHTLTKVSGPRQQAAAGSALAQPFVVLVLDQYGDPLAGATVTFSVTTGGGTLAATTGTTDADGRAATTLTLGRTPGTTTVQATVADLEPVTFTATAEATPDFNGDGVTDFSDFLLFAEAFGGSDPRFDLDGSGSVDFADFLLFAESFGQPARAKLVGHPLTTH